VSATSDLALAVSRLLAEGEVTALTLLRHGPRANVYRADTDAAASMLVKHFPRDCWQAARELSSCSILQSSGGVIARVIALDVAQRIVVFEYVPDALDLFGALRQREPAEVLRQLGEVLGRLIVTTRGATPADPVAAEEAAALHAAWPRVIRWSAALNVASPAGFEAALDALLEHHVRGAPRSLTQGDPAPSNVLFPTVGDALLNDFEYGAMRPVLFDLAQWFVRCPLPQPWFDRLADALSATLYAAGVYHDDGAFRVDLARQESYAALYMFTLLPIERARDADPAWVGDWSVRQALLSASERGGRAARGVTELAPLAAWFGQLHDALRRNWSASGSGDLDWRALVGRAPH
jgi:hypothetical protein